MKRLKLAPLIDDRPVKLTISIPASLQQTLIAYAEALSVESGTPIPDPGKLIVPILQQFIRDDHAFREIQSKSTMGPTCVRTKAISARPQD